ncbi:MAG: hypothetical protein AAFZ18_02845 [Myxococcota bacterium]
MQSVVFADALRPGLAPLRLGPAFALPAGMRSFPSSAGLMLGLFSHIPAATGTTFVELSMSELAVSSEGVVRARVVSVGHRLLPDPALTGEPQRGRASHGLRVMTLVELEIRAWLRGHGPRAVQLWEEGGVLPDGSRWVVDGAPRYTLGEEVVVFLERDPQGRWLTHQMAQGKLTVLETEGGPVLRRDLGAVSLIRVVDGELDLRHGGVEVRSLEGFESALRSLDKRSSGRSE